MLPLWKVVTDVVDGDDIDNPADDDDNDDFPLFLMMMMVPMRFLVRKMTLLIYAYP